MEHPDDFKKLFKQIMSKPLVPLLSEEEIHFDRLAIEVMEMVGDTYVVWLN